MKKWIVTSPGTSLQCHVSELQEDGSYVHALYTERPELAHEVAAFLNEKYPAVIPLPAGAVAHTKHVFEAIKGGKNKE